MTQQQHAAVAESLADLSPSDKLELVERLVDELRSAIIPERPSPADPAKPPTEGEFKRQLLVSGLMSRLPLGGPSAARPVFDPVMIDGEPLSETIVRERR